MEVLEDPDVRQGATLVRPILAHQHEQRRQPVSASTVEDWGDGVSTVLEAVHLAALAPRSA
ncbi:hypothetical protein [Streptomyces sp. SID3343]|uniref:hypothetical protein n=1 Tax=Streptomyces sp. SID3343 TaxID=2690260 RepID=UPI0013685478|nr:hypothetical protein [Streptomyces sp. SID3343]MYW04447.1 hypothetical protein [Streptomyces sp. SID3343]